MEEKTLLRGTAPLSLRDLIRTWASLAQKENALCCRGRHAERIVRTQRLQCIFEKCLCETAMRELSDSKQAHAMLSQCHNAVSVSFANKLLENHQLYNDKNLSLLEGYAESVRRQAISLTRDNADCLYLWKMLGCADKSRESTNISPIRDYFSHAQLTQVNDLMMSKNAQVSQHLASLVERVSADSIQQEHKERTSTENKGLIQMHYISTGINDDPLFSSIHEYDITSSDSPPFRKGDDETSTDTDGFFDRLILDEDTEKQPQSYLNELFAIQESNPTGNKDSTNPVSLVDSIAITAKNNLSVMKLDVDKTLWDVRSSETHLLNYNDFIEKKKRQRVRCLRDLEEHCCTCKGPHIAKPPFSHGKDYRREPTHTKCQKDKCDFLRKKKRELEWIDETLAKYDNNQERFRREIAHREDEIQRKKVIMKDALANSLRLMDIV
ncbi:hypothetical protein HJC23_010462 [Cyclotella cryptica]|uniref:Uncharacterized protein n=1 Tax=Cyclotella cryptica TaxID=29204 RepID=A0ABD3QHG1_9STRA|eukprot:CCRYP_005328-RA/>CCRYP_005328-RA protein AED:0.56 eAED:0.33 QI:0/-1/0/1/-1/1/1/0/438